MPLYEYACKTCDYAFEMLVYDGDRVECPECHSTRLERRWSLPAKPNAQRPSLPMSCHSDAPPCGPGCCRLPN